jgi:hypothetical protein
MFLELCKLSVNLNLKRTKITGWRVKAEDGRELSRIVEQTKTHLGLYSQQKKRRRRRR